MFYVGQKVVCVDAGPCRNPRSKRAPSPFKLNAVYTIAAINPKTDMYGQVGLHFCEVVAKRILDPTGQFIIGWSSSRFRPVVSRSTDTGFAVLEDIRRRESFPAREPTRVLPGGGVT